MKTQLIAGLFMEIVDHDHNFILFSTFKFELKMLALNVAVVFRWAGWEMKKSFAKALENKPILLTNSGYF